MVKTRLLVALSVSLAPIGCDSNMDLGPSGSLPSSKLTHISANKEFTVRLDQAAGLFRVMKDARTAKNRLDDLRGVTRRIQELQTELKALGPAPSAEGELGKLLVEQRKARDRFATELRRVNDLPEVVVQLGDTLVALNHLEN